MMTSEGDFKLKYFLFFPHLARVELFKCISEMCSREYVCIFARRWEKYQQCDAAAVEKMKINFNAAVCFKEKKSK